MHDFANRIGTDIGALFGRDLAYLARPIFAGVEDAVISAQLSGFVELGLMSAGDDRLATEMSGDVQTSQGNPAADPTTFCGEAESSSHCFY